MRFSSVNYHAYRAKKTPRGTEIPCETCHAPFLKHADKKEQKYCSRACAHTAKRIKQPGKKGNTTVILDLIRYATQREKVWHELRKAISIHITKLRSFKHVKGIRRNIIIHREKKFLKRVENAVKRDSKLFNNYYGKPN